MNKPNLNDLEKEIEKKIRKKDRRKKKTMKVSGAGVRTLAKIIKDKK